VRVTPQVEPGRFRWRLTLAFLIVSAVSAGSLAVGAYILVRADRLASFEERAVTSSALALSLAESVTRAEPEIEASELTTRLSRGRVDVVVTDRSDRFASSATDFTVTDIPDGLKADDPVDGFQRARTELGESSLLVLHPTDSPAGFDIYFLFSIDGLEAELSRLAGILFRSWIAVALLSGIAGYAIARSTLRPVAKASEAARSLAEGLLETRLPIGRHDEFGAWALSFNEMADALQQKIEALTASHERERRFTSDVAHELRTPLTGLVGSASLVRSGLDGLDQETRWAVERMLEQVGRVKILVEELLEIARLDAGQQEVNLQTIDLEALLQALVRDRPDRHRVQITSQVPRFSSDPRRLQRVVSNLVDNALVHGGTDATVEAWLEGTSINIVISDEGPGIDPIKAPFIFDRFYKADSTRKGGTGLGLAIARDNARLLGGDVSLEPTPSGTRFVITIPYVPAPSGERDAATSADVSSGKNGRGR
jgi:two-component system sensor histidine kinase MtrB